MRGLTGFILVLSAVFVVACAGGGGDPYDDGPRAAPAETVSDDASASAPVPPPSDPALIAAEYVLGTGDRVNILVFNQENLSGEFVVDGVGEITMPLIQSVTASGLNARQLAQAIEGELEAGWLRNPQVSVQVLSFRPFYIDGEVENPGSYPYVDGLTVRGAVATAGGYTYRADQRRIFILNEGQSEEQSVAVRADTPVRPGDQLRVPNRRF